MPQVDPKQGDEFIQLKEAIQYTREQRKDDSPFDVVYSASLHPGDPARLEERVEQYTQVGITWLLEQLYPQHFGSDWQGDWHVEAMRARIRQGPPTQ